VFTVNFVFIVPGKVHSFRVLLYGFLILFAFMGFVFLLRIYLDTRYHFVLALIIFISGFAGFDCCLLYFSSPEYFFFFFFGGVYLDGMQNGLYGSDFGI
jgi:hypothetical protein